MNATPSPEQRIAAALELIAGETGEAHWRRAANELRRPPPAKRGPKGYDDHAAVADALEQMRVLIAAGDPVETAARHVAVTLGTAIRGNSLQAKTKRLAQRWREDNSGSELPSATAPILAGSLQITELETIRNGG